MKKLAISFAAIILFACNNDSNNNNNTVEDNNNPAPQALSYEVIKTYPHDTSFFTEGLIWYNNQLYESTGLENKSLLVKRELANEKNLQEIKLPAEDFGEGIGIINNKIYQLTWQQNKVYVYDLATFKKLQELNWPYEGWGMTTSGKQFIISTGSSNLYYVNPDDFKVQKIVGVFDNYGPVANINELEYINGYIYANQYETDYILKINPATGKVEGKLDLKDIRQNNKIPIDDHQNVLNGIAYDSVKNSLYVTGKLWPALFEIKLK